MRRFALFLLLALGGGVAWGLCFGREGMLLAPWAALVPLLLALSHRLAGVLGFAFGLAFWCTSIPWIVPVMTSYGGLPGWLAVICLLLLAAFLALYVGLFALLGRRVWRFRAWLLPAAALPALWVALEWLRAHLFSGFPWNLAAYAWVEVPGALPTSAWIGAYGVSYLVLFANTGLALALARRRWEAAALGLLVPLLVLAAGGRWGAGRPVYANPEMAPVRVVQPNLGIVTEPDVEWVLAGRAKLFGLSRDGCEPGALVVWPESATWPSVWSADRGLQRQVAELTEGGCTVLFNSIHPAEGTFYNSALTVDAGGETGRYDKRHLVPFGEYVPLKEVFSFLGGVARGAGNFQPGEEPRLLSWGKERLGVAVCFEITFPAEVAELVRGGATTLVTITNDGWYGDSSAPWQHLRAARFRAAESRRPVLRSALTGVSAIIRPDGSLLSSLGLFREGVLSGRLTGRSDLSPASRRPWRVPLASTVLAVLGLGLAWRRRGRGAGD